MILSVIVLSLKGEIPQSLREQVEGRTDVELVVVRGVSPIGKARNVALARVTGDYIAWVDADDEVSDDWLTEILSALAVSMPDVLTIGHKWVMPDGSALERVWRGGDLLGAVLSQRAIAPGLTPEMWSFVIRRALWDGVRFDDAARVLDDWEVVPQLLSRATKVVRIEKPLYRYFARADSNSHQTDEAMQRDAFERAVGRIAEIKRLGLWEKYGRIAMVGIGYVVYCSAEMLALTGASDSPTKREEERWIRWRLPMLLTGPSRLTFKVKWALAAFGLWGVVRWYYVRIQGRKI